MLSAQQIEQKLKEYFQDAEIKVTDLTGGGDHWQVYICSNEFRNKTLIEQHQLVYKALNTWMNKEIHALAINTSVPSL